VADRDPAIRHAIPGRIRLKASAIALSHEALREFHAQLDDIEGIREITVRPAASCVIVTYDSGAKAPGEIEGHILRACRKASRLVTEREFLRIARRERIGGALIGRGLVAAGLTGFLAHALVRTLVRSSPLPQGPLSATGMVATLGLLPLLRRAWLELREGGKAGLFPFLAVACGLAVATGAALTALEVTWALSVGLFLEGYVSSPRTRPVSWPSWPPGAGASSWWATGSTTPWRSPRRRSASRWAPAGRRSPWRRRTSRSSRATSRASSWRASSAAPCWRPSSRTSDIFEEFPNHVFGVSLLTRQSHDASFSARRDEFVNVIDDAREPGPEESIGHHTFSNDLTEVWGG
jgi:hypothetical protein